MLENAIALSEEEFANFLRARRTIANPNYTTRDRETFPAEDIYQSRQGTNEVHEHHHICVGA